MPGAIAQDVDGGGIFVKARSKQAALSEKLLQDLANLTSQVSRNRFLARRRLYRETVLSQLNDVVRAKLRADTRQALALAESAISIARRLRNQRELGRSLRSKASALNITADNQKSRIPYD